MKGVFYSNTWEDVFALNYMKGVYFINLATHFEGWLHQTLLAELWMARDEIGVCIEIQTHNPVINTRA